MEKYPDVTYQKIEALKIEKEELVSKEEKISSKLPLIVIGIEGKTQEKEEKIPRWILPQVAEGVYQTYLFSVGLDRFLHSERNKELKKSEQDVLLLLRQTLEEGFEQMNQQLVKTHLTWIKVIFQVLQTQLQKSELFFNSILSRSDFVHHTFYQVAKMCKFSWPSLEEPSHCVFEYRDDNDSRFSLIHWAFLQPSQILDKCGANVAHRFREFAHQSFSWMIPTVQILDFILDQSRGRVTDLGCGTGYLAYLLYHRLQKLWSLEQIALPEGGLILCNVGVCPLREEWKNPRILAVDQRLSETLWYPVHQQDMLEFCKQGHANDGALLFSWQKSTYQCLECIENWKGDTIIVCGETDGCTAHINNLFQSRDIQACSLSEYDLEQEAKEREEIKKQFPECSEEQMEQELYKLHQTRLSRLGTWTSVEIPENVTYYQWPGIHDHLTLYRRG